ncbi:MAG: cytochrome PufQ [Pseudomonadota bacterium]
MSDHTANGLRAPRKGPSIEYRCYFAIIFMFTLPWAFCSWALGLARPDADDASRGFVGRAWHQASVITPLIFSQ